MLKGPVGYGRLVNIVMNGILGLCISIVMLASIGVPCTPEALIQSWFSSFCIGYMLGDLVPIAQVPSRICQAMGTHSGAALYLMSALVLGLFFGTGILFGNAIIGCLPTMGWGGAIGFFVHYWTTVAVSAVVLVAVFLWLAQKIASTVSGFDPAQAVPNDK